MTEFKKILKRKREYYGNTEAAIEFAVEEYVKSLALPCVMCDLTKEEVVKVADILENAEDMGPPDEGWKSEGLSKLSAKVSMLAERYT